MMSDRNAKKDFVPVDSQAVLAQVTALPLTTWSYKAEQGARHLGPMAQDFHAAFGLNGDDDRYIAEVDEGGVALAAIQGLNQKVDERVSQLETGLKRRDAENAELKRQNEALAKRLEALEKIIRRRDPN
jgi:hypothetical protein